MAIQEATSLQSHAFFTGEESAIRAPQARSSGELLHLLAELPLKIVRNTGKVNKISSGVLAEQMV
jgi:hypothetical protein